MERRTFIKTTSLATVGILSKSTFSESDKSLVLNDSFNHVHTPIELKFKASSMKGFSEKMIKSHLDKNYQGSVKTLNEIRKKLREALDAKDTPAYVYNDLKREHLMRTGSVINHELYFNNLGGNGRISGKIETYIKKSFGSRGLWEEEFRKIANGLAGGPGWVILGYNRHLKILENYWVYDHMHGVMMTTPLLVMDMYEHSYQIDYGAAATKYIDAFFNNINWDEVNRRVDVLA